MKLIIICIFFMSGCSSIKMVDCYNIDNDGRKFLKKAEKEIKLYYLNVEKGEVKFKRILKFECVNDSIIEIDVLNSDSLHGHFLFDEYLNIKDVHHSFPQW